MREYQAALREELRDEDYRYAYAEDFLNTFVAAQIKVLREQRELTQQDLADLIGTKQAGISRLENVNYSSWKTETLRRIARALGVRLRITFETFGTLLDDAARFSRQNLERPDFVEDSAFQEQVVELNPAEGDASSNAIAVTGSTEQTSNNSASIAVGYETAAVTGHNALIADAAGKVPQQIQAAA